MSNAPIQFDLTAKQDQKPISFVLNKITKYFVELYWDSAHDLDVHAIMMENGSHKNNTQNIVSTYNPTLVLVENKNVNHVPGGVKPFCNTSESITHLGDVQTGLQVNEQQPDETIILELGNIPTGRDQIMFFIGIHPPSSAKFDQVKNAKMIVRAEDGTKCLQANVTADFNAYDIAQVGSFKKEPVTGEWQFDPSAMGLNGDFNSIVAATYLPA